MGRMNRVLSVLVGGMVALSAVISTAEASKLDAYRNILMGNSYTIKYENITPPPRTTNRDKLPLFGKSGLSVEQNDYLTNRQRKGIIVNDGVDRYEEVGDGNFNQCQLIKGEEVFSFTKYRKDETSKTYEYVGAKKNKVEAVPKNYLAEAVEGQGFGDSEVSKLINAMLPGSKKSANLPDYSYVASGTLAGGLSFEDYRGKVGGVTSIIRYYFSGMQLVKIASADYYRKPNGALDGHKCIVKIAEFSSMPDKTLLKLPAGVEDVTKRDKEKTK